MKLPLYQGLYQIKLRDTDAAGVLYFAQIYTIIHGVYESFMQFSSLSLDLILTTKKYHLPIIHSEADYKQAICLNDKIEIQIFLEKLTTHTFSLCYLLFSPKQQLLAQAKTIHLAIDKDNLTKIPLPIEIVKIFN